MGIIEELLEGTRLPKMVRVSQKFSAPEVQDIISTLHAELRRLDIASRIRPGMRIAVAVGSRGMANLQLIVQVVIEELKRYGAKPYIVPAMGSHGGATSEGQRQILAGLGITETSVCCSIIASMDVVKLGESDNGLPVYLDKAASQADGIVVINRIKAHSAFSGLNESGLVKMITIGLGKQKGAEACHLFGLKDMANNIVKMATVALQQAPFLFGVGTIENAYDRIAKIAVLPAEGIIKAEQTLLREAKTNMPKLLLQPLDVLIVDQLGKEFSGSGMDPHITGRASTSYFTVGPQPNKLVVLDISDHSDGNATGMGMADITTRRMFDKINFNFTYANVITSTALQAARIPIIMDSDRLAIETAIKTCNVADPNNVRVMRIANTLHIKEIFISECILEEAKMKPGLSIASSLEDFVFDKAGNLVDIGRW